MEDKRLELEQEIAGIEGQIEELYKAFDEKMTEYKSTFNKSA